MTCPNCGAAGDADIRYCANCGYAVNAPPRSVSGRGILESGTAGFLTGIFTSPFLYVAILSFGSASFGNIGPPPPNTEFGVARGEADFDMVVSIVLALSLMVLFVFQRQMRPFLRAFAMTVAFLLLGGFLLCDVFVYSALGN